MGRHGVIANRKASQDAKRGQLFTKYARLITVAAKAGGDPIYNIALKNAIDKAKGINMPNDNINRAIKKGTGELEGELYEAINYEGYGPGGVAIIVDSLTDNKNRTSSQVKHFFDKYNGNLGVPGCVTYMFERKGYFLIEKTEKVSEEALMETALEAGMEDMNVNEDSFEIITATEDFENVKAALQEAGYEFVEADLELLPTITAPTPSAEDLKLLKKLVAALEDHDDVQKVYHNCDEDLYGDE
ncbi:MAG: YebC/PmpR family DNA-binding transcriptional regulator [Clostridiales bacterium]|nr:YebC/PmpR family DNA-binding transcriptional regulator [Clostridiales bacterium]